MSHTFRNVVDALLIGALAFFMVLSWANSRLVDAALKREVLRPACASVPYQALERGARCVVREVGT